MKLNIVDEKNIIVFLNKYYMNNFDFKSKQILEDKLRDLFLKLNIYYNIKINGYYDVKIYIDNYYGVIISLERNSIDYIDYDDGQIDMKIVILETDFLYCLNDIFDFYDKYIIYKYNNNFYLKLDKEISNIEMGRILENSIIIYDNRVEKILKYGTLLNNVL